MAFKSKVYDFLNRIVTIKENKTNTDVIKYDIDNLFPQNLIRQISESGTASACIDILNQYTYAEGLVDEELGKVVVNENGQTLNQLIKEITPYVTMFNGVTLHITRNSTGGIGFIKFIPFEYLRKKDSETFVYNPTWSLVDRYDKNLDVLYPKFQGLQITPEDFNKIKETYGEYKGEIFYFFNKKPGQYIYPIPFYYPAISDIEVDSELSKYDLESINNSFLTNGILTVVGDIDDKTEDEHGMTEYKYLSETCESFTGNKKDQKGETGRQKMMLLHAKTKEELPTYQSVNNEGVFSAVESLAKRNSEKVARTFGVPNFLIGLGGNVGFASNIISDNITLFNNRILPLQNLITDAFETLFPEKDFELTQLMPIKYIDPAIYSKLTTAEIRALAGYKTEEPIQPTTQPNGIPSVNN